jgi:anti-sigma factor RsiW
MIPAAQLELITAAVDGELSTSEERVFRRLLAASAQARALYEKLQADRARVGALPQATPPGDLRAKILARIATATPAPRTHPNLNQKPVKRTPQSAPPAQLAQPAQNPVHGSVPFPSRRVPAWVPVAVAASLLVCVTAGSFAFFSTQGAARNQNTAKHPWTNALPVAHDAPAAVPSPTAVQLPEAVRPDPNAIARIPDLPVPHDPLLPVGAEEGVALAPEPRPVPADLLGTRILPPIRPFEYQQARVPFLRTLAELAREDIRQELIDDLGRDPAFRLDLFVRDTARGAEVFRNAAKATGLKVFADAATLEKLNNRQVAAVVIYAENLTAVELAALFARLSAEDAKFSPRVCDSLHAAPIVRADEFELRQILGIDAGLFKRAIGSGRTGQGGAKPARTGEPTKPISAGTIDSVVKSVTNPTAKGDENTAVLMTWQTTHPSIPRTHPEMSAELTQFLAKRPDRKPNAIPSIIVIRQKP